MRPKIAFFDFAGCEGCQLQVLNLEDEIIQVVGLIDIVNFREAMSDKSNRYDIAFVEGSITREQDIKRLKDIRQRAKVLVAFGACACIGGINFMKNFHNLNEVKRTVYGDKANLFDTDLVKPINKVVPVDYYVYGCPIHKNEFLEVTKSLLLGKKPDIPNYPVCMECKLAENACVFDKGLVCLGPITRAGCGAWCPSQGNGCEGCRGLVDNANSESMKEILAQHGLSSDEVINKFRMFAGYAEVSK